MRLRSAHAGTRPLHPVDRAIVFLRESFTDHRGKFVPPERARKNELARDKRFTSLRKLPAWKKLVS